MSLRRQLLLVSLLVLVLPWAAYEYVQAMDRALREAQRSGLLTTTRAVALLSSQNLHPVATSRAGLFAHPIERPVILDGYVSDWQEIGQWLEPVAFTGTRRDSGGRADGTPPLRLVAGSRDGELFLLLVAHDDSVRYFNPARALPNGDRVLLRLRSDGAWRDYVFLTSAPGSVVARELDGRELGARVPALQAGWHPFEDGFRVEIRIPADPAVERLAVFWIDSDAGGVPRWWGTAEHFGADEGLVIRRPEPQLAERLHEFIGTGTRVRVIDAEGWVVADVERALTARSAEMTVRGVTGAIAQRLVRAVLESEAIRPAPFTFARGRLGESSLVDTARSTQTLATEWFKPERFADAIVAAAMPLTLDGQAAGTLLVEQRSDLVAAVTASAVTRLVVLTFLAVIVVAGGLLLYSSFLSWRIRRLRNSVETAIGEDGTVTGSFVESAAADEIGDLSRGYAQLLRQVREYTDYLRKLASNLSHELRTPLAVVSSSLENLQTEQLGDQASVYAERAQQGAKRLRAILNAMSEASRVEQALQSGDRHAFDLHALLCDVVPAYRDVYPNCRIELVCDEPEQTWEMLGVPELMVQMLDKLIDNAADFVPPGGLLEIRLAKRANALVLSVKNDGPLLPEAMQSRLFEPMVSLRNGQGKVPHLGFGLHIVRMIVQLHDGRVSAHNAPDGSGVVIVVELPARKP